MRRLRGSTVAPTVSRPSVPGAVGATLGGLACDHLSERYGLRWGCRVPVDRGARALWRLIAGAAASPSALLAVAFLSLCLGCQQFTAGAYWSATIGVGSRHCATACGVLNTGGNVVGGIGASMVPITVERLGWGPALATASPYRPRRRGLWIWIRADRTMEVASR